MRKTGVKGLELTSSIALSCLCLTGSAKTIALWPIEWDEANQCRDGHCAERPVVDFASQSAFRLGADDGASTCAGGYDLWRVSSCLLNQSELLAPTSKQGLVFFVQ